MDPNMAGPASWEHGWWAAFGAGVAAMYTGVKWWFHVRRLNNADKVDGSVSKSLEFVLNEMRHEIHTLKLEVDGLKRENMLLRSQAGQAVHLQERINDARALLTDHVACEEETHRKVVDLLS